MEIRRATLADIELLAALNAYVHDVHLRSEPEQYRVTDGGELRAWFAERLADPDVVIFIASAERPVGFIVTAHARAPVNPFSPLRERLLVDQIAVDPTQRRIGVGRALMDVAERRAAELGLRSVQLDVRAFNSEAARFYEALGYLPVQHRLERRVSEIAIAVRGEVREDELQRLFAASWPERGAQSYAAVLAKSLLWVTARTSELVGFVNVATDGGERAFLIDTTVHPSARLRGVGRSLVRAAVAATKSRGLQWLHVDYAPAHERFYRSCGFTTTRAGLIDLQGP
ncbi:MAG TPA: GNAT family N-acetyltransferase [Polyangiales bacterium]|nr:GNAT family N-acetyltransferase [Polyangiales bacterium]